MEKFLEILKLLILIIGFVGLVEGNCYNWRDIKGDPENHLKGAIVAGEENGKPVHICSLKYEGRWVTGKLFYSKHQSKYVCHCADMSNVIITSEFKNEHYRIFYARSGCTSWTPKDKMSRRSAIIGGRDQYDEKTLICRHRLSNGKMMVGNYLPKEKKCYYFASPTPGETKNAIEILVMNASAK